MTRRAPRFLYVLLFIWVAMSMSYYVAGAAALNATWFHGERHGYLPFGLHYDRTLHRLEEEAKKAGLADGDLLQSLNGHQYTGYFQLTNYLRHSRPGDVAQVIVQHPNGAVRSAAIHLKPWPGQNLSPDGYIAYLSPVLGVTLLSLMIGYWVVGARPKDPYAWLVLILLTFFEASFGDIDAVWWGGVWYIVFTCWSAFVEILAFPALLWFGFFFPERSRIDVRFPWVKWLILVMQCFGFGAELWLQFLYGFDASLVTRFAESAKWIDQVEGGTALACMVLFLIAIFDNVRSASTPDARRRLRVLAVGSGLSLIPLLIMFGVLPIFGYSFHHGFLFRVAIPFLVLFPLTLAYVLIVQRAMDLRVLLRMGTKYLLAQATLNVFLILVAGFLVLRFIVPMIQQKQHQTVNLFLVGTVIALLFWAFIGSNSLSNRLQKWLDRKFFREAYNAETLLSELSEHARKLTEKGPLLDTVSRQISEVLHVPKVAVWLRGSDTFHLQQAFGYTNTEPVFFSEHSATVENLALTSRPATVYRDRPAEWLSRAKPEERLVLDRLDAEVLLPLAGRDRLLGVMTLGPKRSEEAYTPTDLRVLQAVATQTGLALEVTELAHSLANEAALRARANRELEIAHEVQERLFPQQMPVIPGISLAGFCRPAQGVGGDYYDAFELADGRLGLAIGDVSGKGIPAALLMASLRACLRTMTLVGPADLAELMRKMNQLVYEASAVNRYATFFFAIYQPADRTLTYVNAGHNPPVLLRCSPKGCLRLDAGGPVVGLLPHLTYVEASVTLSSGDLLLAYTDGISEAMTAEDEEWGEDRMISSAELSGEGSADDLLRSIFAAADRFTGNAPQHDDMTLLVAKLS